MNDSLFADQEARTTATLEKIIHAKTLPFKFEKEYRLAIPSDEEGDWSLYPYHPEEVTELYIGLAMADSDKRDILAAARATNPNMKVFQVSRDAQKKLNLRPI